MFDQAEKLGAAGKMLEIFRHARKQGRREQRDRYAFDAVMQMARLARAAYYGYDYDIEDPLDVLTPDLTEDTNHAGDAEGVPDPTKQSGDPGDAEKPPGSSDRSDDVARPENPPGSDGPTGTPEAAGTPGSSDLTDDLDDVWSFDDLDDDWWDTCDSTFEGYSTAHEPLAPQPCPGLAADTAAPVERGPPAHMAAQARRLWVNLLEGCRITTPNTPRWPTSTESISPVHDPS